MDKLISANETTIAVGNQNVNARGDEIGPGGKIIKSRADRVASKHALHTMIPNDDRIPTSASDENERALKAQALLDQQAQTEQAIADEAERMRLLEEQTANAPKNAKAPKGGLASALAKSQTVEHKALDPKPTRKKKGVKRL